MSLIEVRKIGKSYGSHKVLEDITFDIGEHTFVSIFGPNASGKTTLLNIIAGLTKPDEGEIIWKNNNKNISISYVFQNYRESLFPWKNVWENIALPLKLKGKDTKIQKDAVNELVERYSIDIPLNKFPYQLSGGQQQMVAILRALITQPDLLLLDEPFSALDFQRRLFLQNKILEIWEQTEMSVLFISHDLEEAIYLADKVLLFGKKPTQVISERIVSMDRPRNVESLLKQEFINVRELLLNDFLIHSDKKEVL